MGMECSMNGGEEEFIKDIGVKARRKEATRRPRNRWEDNIKMKLKRG
jgi:translation initiation factor RLI1